MTALAEGLELSAQAAGGERWAVGAMDTTPQYTMSVAARLAGVPAHRLRSYERAGVLHPGRLGARNRLFSDADIERARHIAELARQGINMAGIRAILAMEEHTPNTTGG